MHAALIVLTVVEIAIFVAAVAFYLLRLAKSLEHTSANLTKVRAGVRAVEGHCAPIGTAVGRVNAQLQYISGALATLADLAGRATSGSARDAGRRP